VIATRLAPDRIEIKIVWVSGHFSLAQVTPPIHRQADVSKYEEILERIGELSQNGQTDAQIAAQLTQEGYHTARRGIVSTATVRKLRLRNGWVSQLHQRRRMSMVNGYWTIPGLIQELGVGRKWLSHRIRQGFFQQADLQLLSDSRTYLIRNDPLLLERLRTEVAASRKPDTSHS
jgi:hypothetical protein